MRLISALLMAGVLLAADKKESQGGGLCAPPVDKASPSLPAKLMPEMGQVHMAITTSNPEAQKFFDQGLAQMHSFWAREAERSFLQAAQLDPAAPMPWFGVAMVSAGDYRPQFQIESGAQLFGPGLNTSPRATAAVEWAQKLAAVPGKATEVEKLYIKAMAARRNLKSKTHYQDYVAGLREVLKANPQEVEARLFLSLALMRGYVLPEKTPREGTMESVAIIRQLLKELPNHPGVPHYMIHAWEGSTFAAEAENPAHNYARLAAGIPHALHMPGHIFSQTGKWGEAAKYFELCLAKEIGMMKADALYGTGHHAHNAHYLSMSYSFGGEFGRALETATRLFQDWKNTPREDAQIDAARSPAQQAQFAMLRTLVQHEKWDQLLDGATVPVIDKVRPRAWHAWGMALAHAAKGDVAGARHQEGLLEKAVDEVRKTTFDREAPELAVARLEVRGQVLIAEGKLDEGFRVLAQASEREGRLVYSEPSWYPRPVAEGTGWAALRHGRTEEARRAFATALRQYPADARALAGIRELDKAHSGGQ
jgi:tetratricopeptide (TPR) repeat protein